MKGLVAAVLVAGLFAPAAADAQWTAQAGAPDVFGNRTVVAVAGAMNGDGLTIQCNQKDTLEIAYLFPETPD